MQTLDAIEALNADQYATPTDRLLFGAPAKRRPSRRPSQLAVRQEEEATVYVRSRRRRDAAFIGTARAALFGAAAGALSAWAAIVIACLLA